MTKIVIEQPVKTGFKFPSGGKRSRKSTIDLPENIIAQNTA